MFDKEIIAHAESNPLEEVCGILIENQIKEIELIKMENYSDDKGNNFSIPPSAFIKSKIKNKIIGVYHSHTKTSCLPSKNDKQCSNECGLPYLIYSIRDKDFFLYFPESYKSDELIGRVYIKGFNECTCLFKDYYNKILDLNISDWNENYWLPEKHKEANELLLNILNNNMHKVDINTLSKHDLIVFDINNKRYHVGVYDGGDHFMHQPINGLSSVQLLDDRWQSKIDCVYRHPNFV